VRVAYLLKRFPRLSETFILHEILELERQGLNLRVYSLLHPAEPVVHRGVARVQAPVRYVPEGPAAAVLRHHAAVLWRTPLRYLGVVTYILGRRRSLAALKHFGRAGWLAVELERDGITHLHAHFAHGPASVAHFVHLLTGMPYSFTAHAKDIYTSPPDLLAVKMRAARFVVTCTDYNLQYLSEIDSELPERHVKRIYHGVDLSKFRPPDHLPGARILEATPTILAVGRLVEKKGFPYLVEAFRLLIDRGYNVQLRIVGSGEQKASLERQIREPGLAGRAKLLGARAQDDLIDLYREATLFVLPCIVTENGDRDGIPNVLVEAMCLALPVVSTNISGIPELVVDGETGLLVPPRDPEALAAAMARLLDDPALRQTLAERGMCRVSEEFDLAANAARLRALLMERAA
jgi:glycosyltransferase involved in cell wall biosynthesis